MQTGSFQRLTDLPPGEAPLPDLTARWRLLVVDDAEANVRVLTRILERGGYTDITGMTSPEAALRSVRAAVPDLILLDQHMPGCDGIDLLASMEPYLATSVRPPVLFLSGDNSPALRRRALAAGATDFIAKPFDPTEVLLRISNLLAMRHLQLTQHEHNLQLEDRVRERTRDLEKSHRELLERLCRVAAYRDDTTGEHTRRVGRAAHRIALALGLDPDFARLVGEAAELHDLGKVGVPDDILHKPGPLDARERAVMRRHTTIGAEALSGSSAPILKLAEEIARSHHECWDGGGYPGGLAGEEIPLSARIVAVADVADALSHDRPYRLAWSPDAVVKELLANAGTQFDPRVIEAYIRTLPAIEGPDAPMLLAARGECR